MIFLLHGYLLPKPLASANFLATGVIASLPEHHEKSVQFLFILNHSTRLWLSWYYPPPVHLCIGDIWQLHIRLKPPDKNYLIAKNIQAVGSVQMDFNDQLIKKGTFWSYPVGHIRQAIQYQLEKCLHHQPYLGFISALTIGVRDRITQAQWEDLRNTGTNHLMAVAGLHIGFVLALINKIIYFIWRRSYYLLLMLPAQDAALMGGLVMIFLYSLLSGFLLPAQRAFIMLTVFLITRLWRIKLSLWTSYFFALGLILSFEPLSILTETCWLSFGAVFLLIYAHSGRLGPMGVWWHWTRAQWIMALGLMPLGLLFFHQFSWVGFLANCLAIPVVGFIILPLCLLGIINVHFWMLAEYVFNYFWPVIRWLGKLPHSQYYIDINNGQLISLFFAVILLLAPKGFPCRWIGLLGFLPILFKH